MHNFRPAFKSGQWQVHEPRETPSAHTCTHTHSQLLSQSVACVWAPKPHFPGPNRFTPHLRPWQKFFSSVYSIRLAQKGLTPTFVKPYPGSQAGNAWLNGKRWCWQARSSAGWGRHQNAACKSPLGKHCQLDGLSNQMHSFIRKDTSDHTHTLKPEVSANSQFAHSMEAYHQATNSACLHGENKFYLLTCYQQQ